jgi:protein-tyrosine-phosphatase
MRALALACLLAIAAQAAPARAAPPAQPLEVVFVCQYGYAKSLVAAKHFERMAAERGLEVSVVARGLTPKDSVPAAIAQALRADGLAVDGYAPVALSAGDVASADLVVSFGVDSPHPTKARVLRWDDVGALSEDYSKAREQIRSHLGPLLDELSAR